MIQVAAGSILYTGSGSPEGAQTGSPGDLYLDTAGGVGATLYRKQSGVATNTGWMPDAKFGTAADHSTFESDGTLLFEGNATVWDDITMSIAVDRTVGAGLAAMPNGFSEYRFNTGQSAEYVTQELRHSYKQGSQIEFHVHWVTGAQDATQRAVNWQLEYSYVPNGATVAPFPVYSAAVAIAAETAIPANTPAGSEITTSVGTLLDVNLKMGSRIMLRITRIASVGTAPSALPFVTQTGIHIEMDTAGSRQMYVK